MFGLSGVDFANAERAAERSLRAAAYHMAAADAALIAQQRVRSASLALEEDGARRSALLTSRERGLFSRRGTALPCAATPLGLPKPAEDWNSKTHSPVTRASEGETVELQTQEETRRLLFSEDGVMARQPEPSWLAAARRASYGVADLEEEVEGGDAPAT